jgi:hypothetical protein
MPLEDGEKTFSRQDHTSKNKQQQRNKVFHLPFQSTLPATCVDGCSHDNSRRTYRKTQLTKAPLNLYLAVDIHRNLQTRYRHNLG